MKRPELVSLRARALLGVASAVTCAAMCACATAPAGPHASTVSLPMLTGWFQGQPVYYVTTDVSDADVARAKDSNFAPRLADALPASGAEPGRKSAVDVVYGITNFAQGSIFASAPEPMGHANQYIAYSPLWQMTTVTWRPGQTPRLLKSEEEVLDAAVREWVDAVKTRVVLNCPIVHRGVLGGLPGVSIGATKAATDRAR